MELEEAKLIIAQRISDGINGRYEIPILETVLSHELGTRMYKRAIESLQSERSIKEHHQTSNGRLRLEWVVTEFGKAKYNL